MPNIENDVWWQILVALPSRFRPQRVWRWIARMKVAMWHEDLRSSSLVFCCIFVKRPTGVEGKAGAGTQENPLRERNFLHHPLCSVQLPQLPKVHLPARPHMIFSEINILYQKRCMPEKISRIDKCKSYMQFVCGIFWAFHICKWAQCSAGVCWCVCVC